jgi:hypothetical protein
VFLAFVLALVAFAVWLNVLGGRRSIPRSIVAHRVVDGGGNVAEPASRVFVDV